MLVCPGCQSPHLMIREASGLERLKIRFTGKREYRCVACEHIFRAVDRRRYQRASADDSVELPASDHNFLK
ncbi:MAG: hypothetical protein JWN34_3166 [Bryobacterales bacterium]|nr:hypothetical protein [Bryobacterales bacterium]